MDMGRTALGIELGSTRIKAVAIDENNRIVSSGDYTWKSDLVNGVWTYPMDKVWEGLNRAVSGIENRGEIGCAAVSAMMHGYLPFDENWNLLTPFRTWQNTMTAQAAEELSALFGVNIPQRWSIAHLYQAVLNGEEHIGRIAHITTLAGYVHHALTGVNAVGVGEASGIFPIDPDHLEYNAEALDKFRALARKYHLTPAGTMVHEWIMCVGQGNHKHNPAYSNYYGLDAWVKEYGVLNGTALTDTITTDCFLRDFNLTFATLFSGVRHDSGDPIIWGEKMLEKYKKLGIDATTKTLLFSDSLNFEKANAIYEHFKDRCKVAFGIGTYLSNDTYDEALNIVMKVTRCNGQDVAKISDVEGKGMCKNEEYVDYLTRSIKWRMENEVDKNV